MFGRKPPPASAGGERNVEPIFNAGKELLGIVVRYYSNERGVHSETVIGALAALFGEWSLRASGAALPEQGWVLSSETNHLLIEGPRPLWFVVAMFAERAGVPLDDQPDPMATIARTVAAFGKRYPAVTVPEDHFPLEWSPVAGPRFRRHVQDVARRHNLQGADIAEACGIALGLILDLTKDALDPRIGVRLAQEVAFGVARMAPLKEVDLTFTPYKHAA